MGDFEDKLGAILNNPQAMGQIMSLAQSLGAPSPSDPPAEPPPAPSPLSAPSPPIGDAGGLTGGLGALDPRLIGLAARVMSEYNSKDDGRTALLQALRPFVKEQRYAKLDRAIQIARLSRLIRVALDAFKGGDDDHV